MLWFLHFCLGGPLWMKGLAAEVRSGQAGRVNRQPPGVG